MGDIEYHGKAKRRDRRQDHILHQRQYEIDHAHPRSPHKVIDTITPIQVANVSRLAIAQRASPVLMCPLNISATELINGKPGTSSSTLAAIAIVGVLLKVGNVSSKPEMVVATKAVMQKLICGCKCRDASIWRIYIATMLAKR